MPRPKRPKLVHTVPSTLRLPDPAAPPPFQKQQPPHSSSSEHTTNASDDTDGLVKRKKGWSKTHANGAAQYTMSGALRPHASTIARESPRSETSSQPSGRSSVQIGVSQTSRLHRRGHGQQEAGVITMASSAAPKPASLNRRPSGKLRTSNANLSDQASLSSRVQGTPLAQSSVLGAIQFKKRARQPSLLQLAQSQQEPAANLNDDFLDFLPDDESTPLAKSSIHLVQSHSSGSKASRPRKRKLSSPEIQVPASQSQSQQQAGFSSISLPQPVDDSFGLPSDDEDERAEPELPRYHQIRTPSPGKESDTMAPPHSSSPMKSPAKARQQPKPKQTTVDKTGTRKQPRRSPSPAQLPQSTASTPQKKATRKKPPAPKPLTTASLQNLLPRRRARKQTQNTYDIPSSSEAELDLTNLGEDEDELSLHAKSRLRRSKSMAGGKSKTTKPSKGKENATPSVVKTKQVSKTYSRNIDDQSHIDDDDEGDGPLEDTSFEIDASSGKALPSLDAKAKAEMKRLAQKFKEVDEYSMEFEDMTGSSSQMKDAR